MKTFETDIVIDGNEFRITLEYTITHFAFDTPPQLHIARAFIGDWDIKDSATLWTNEVDEEMRNAILEHEYVKHPITEGDDLAVFRDDLIK